MTDGGSPLRICVDFGSTFTKAVLVDLTGARVLARAEHPTTIDTDVLDGLDACRAELTDLDPRAAEAETIACSSAGGGLRIAVVGNEELVTAEAGRRVALSSGGTVVLVLSGGLDARRYADLCAAEPDVLLLVGGTDGGNAEVLEHDAAFLAERGWSGPVVVAGNVDSRAVVTALLEESRTPYLLADNVVPRIGVLAPDSARHAIREVFLSHVIGGKHLSSRGSEFVDMVRGATPDVVLTGVEVLARGLDAAQPGAGEVVVVDVGGATTDVHSVVGVDPEDSGLAREVVATTPVTRTVEGDLGMRWSAVGTIEAMHDAGLVAGDELSPLAQAAVRRREGPGWLPATEAECAEEEAIARGAVRLALQRHAGRARVVLSPEGRVVERTGKDLREVDLLVGSGGVLRHGAPGVADRVLGPSTGEQTGGWQLPRGPRVVVDELSLLAAVGLLAGTHPEVAHRLAQRLLSGRLGSLTP